MEKYSEMLEKLQKEGDDRFGQRFLLTFKCFLLAHQFSREPAYP